MKRRNVTGLLLMSALVVGCTATPPAPPALAYGMPADAEAVYDFGDTTVVYVDAMGQRMELGMGMSGVYDVMYAPASTGVDVTMAARSFSATVTSPMGAPIRADESDIDGELTFTLDRVGNATVTGEPGVSDVVSQVLSGVVLVQGFFPGLPGRAVVPGDSWVDTIDVVGGAGEGQRSDFSILRYTVQGDSTVDGRTYLSIALEGTTEISTEMDMGGMTISQSSDLEMEGHILWDLPAGRVFETRRSGRGSGTVSVPNIPFPLPIQVETSQLARFRGN